MVAALRSRSKFPLTSGASLASDVVRRGIMSQGTLGQN
jgi:hypothetical protein